MSSRAASNHTKASILLQAQAVHDYHPLSPSKQSPSTPARQVQHVGGTNVRLSRETRPGPSFNLPSQNFCYCRTEVYVELPVSSPQFFKDCTPY